MTWLCTASIASYGPLACLIIAEVYHEQTLWPLALWQWPIEAIRYGPCPSHYFTECRAEDKVRALQKSTSCSCSMLTINSLGRDNAENGNVGHAGLWRAHFRARLPRASAGELPERPQEPEQAGLAS